MSCQRFWFGLACGGMLFLLAACASASPPTAAVVSAPTLTLPAPTATASATAAPTLAPAATATASDGGGTLLFSSNRGGVYADLYVMNLNGSGVIRLTQGNSNFFAGPWSPDGQKLPLHRLWPGAQLRGGDAG